MESLLTSGQNLKHISKLYIYISCSSLFILFSFWRFQITDILRNNYISFRYAQRYFLSLFLNSTPLLFISSLSVVHWGKDMCVNSKKKKGTNNNTKQPVHQPWEKRKWEGKKKESIWVNTCITCCIANACDFFFFWYLCICMQLFQPILSLLVVSIPFVKSTAVAPSTSSFQSSLVVLPIISSF